MSRGMVGIRASCMDCGAGLNPGAPVFQPALVGLFTGDPGGLPTRRRLKTCPTTSTEFPFLGKLSGIRQECLRQIVYRTGQGRPGAWRHRGLDLSQNGRTR